jgi:type VI secretion system protein ImpM
MPDAATRLTVRSQRLNVGCYGKLPSHGDFLQRRVPGGFVPAWDAWLQEAMLRSQEVLRERWLDLYLTSPVWRFFCAPGVCGASPVVGLVVPSVDRVGRYFPFTVVTELPAASTPVLTIRQAAPLLASAEWLVLDILASNDGDFEAFDHSLAALGQDQAIAIAASLDVSDASAIIDCGNPSPLCLSTDGSEQLAAVFDQLVTQRLTSLYGPISIWWTDGSSAVQPSALIVRGLPAPEFFTAMLDGTWSERGWKTIPIVTSTEPATRGAAGLVAHYAIAPEFRSAALTDVGRMREVNQDAYLERAEVGVWVVADGLGGHREGDIASRMVCDALADLTPEAHLPLTVEAARRRLDEVNGHLNARAEQRGETARSASTVVALFAHGSQLAMLWAGDSRAYRWRGDELEQMTHDHSLGGALGELAHKNSSAITRAVGAEPTLHLETLEFRAEPGDRFLLCTDGLTRVLSDACIREYVGLPDIRQAVNRLIAETLHAGAPDNVTALIVEASTRPVRNAPLQR